MNSKLESLKKAIYAEKRKTYKIRILYNDGCTKEEAWKIISELEKGFSASTFKLSWEASEKSKGRTPLINNL